MWRQIVNTVKGNFLKNITTGPILFAKKIFQFYKNILKNYELQKKRNFKILLEKKEKNYKKNTFRLLTMSSRISVFLARDVKWNNFGHKFVFHISVMYAHHCGFKNSLWKESTTSALIMWEISIVMSAALGKSHVGEFGRRNEMKYKYLRR